MITITYWEWISIRAFVTAFNFLITIYIISIKIVSKKCIPYIPEYGKARTKSKDSATGI